ncbi:MAG: STAS domain-containing protein [Vicinamibacterales bacterium]
MQIQNRVFGDVTLLTLTGRLTVNEHPGLLKEAVDAAVGAGTRHIVIDLSDVHYVDSTRLGELMAAQVTVSRHGGRLKLAGTPPRVLDLLTMAGLADIFERFDSAEQALQSLAG